MHSDHGEREKLSWSEIDKKKDRSSAYGNRKDEPRGKRSSQRTMDKYKKALDSLFSPGKKLTKQQAKKIKKLNETADRTEFLGKANEYIEEFGLPNLWEDLETFLRLKEPKILSEAIRRMETQLIDQTEMRKNNFIKDLSLIEMTTRDKDLRLQVKSLLRDLQNAES